MRNLSQIPTMVLLLIASIFFFAYSPIDMWIQDHLFNTITHHWTLDRNLQPYRFIFYDGIKAILLLFAFILLILLIFFRKKKFVLPYKQGLLIVVLSAIMVPLSVSTLKRYTNMPCPKHSIHYGGIYPETKVWEPYPASFTHSGTVKCWPAGHASGGFALLSLFFLFKGRKNRRRSILFALSVGWVMGGYKMLIGDHYFSHTWITMILSWLLILSIAKVVMTLSQEDRSAPL